MRRLLAGTAVTGTLAAVYAAAGDLDAHRVRLAIVLGLFWAGFVVVTRWVSSGGAPDLARPVLTVLAVALAVQLPGLTAPPRSSSDAYRYVWDGRVQLAGISPYRYVPLDDRLARLRDPVIFPGLGPDDRSGVLTTALPTDRSELLARTHNDPRTRINRPLVPTIYPPVAQAWFAGVAALTPWRLGTLGLQLAAALLAAGLAAGIAALLRRRGRSPLGALWWAWCPTVVAESSNGAHLDILAAAFLVIAVSIAGGHAVPSVQGRTGEPRVDREMLRWVLAGVLVGLAAAVKIAPLVVLPALMPWRRIRWRAALAPVTAVATMLATYLPYVFGVGWLVLGYLPGYLREESGPNRAGVLALLLPRSAAGVLAVALVLLLAGVVTTRLAADPAWGATVLLGGFLLALTPTYAWYAVPLVALAVLAGRLEWLAVAAAGGLAYAGASVPPVPALAYAASGVVVAAAMVRRRAGLRREEPCETPRSGLLRPDAATTASESNEPDRRAARGEPLASGS